MLLTINGTIEGDGAERQRVVSREFLGQEGIFETFRVYDCKAFKLDDHLERLRTSADRLHIEFPAELHSLMLNEIVRAGRGGLENASCRITLSRGGTESFDGPTLVTQVEDLPVFDDSWYSSGIRVTVASGRRNEFAQNAGLKTTASLASILEFRAVKRTDAEDMIFLDTTGHICEGSASNIFFYDQGVLVTPPLTCGVLPGITRAAVISIAKTAGISLTDSRPVDAATVRSGFEMFLTSSIREIVPVVSVDGNEIGSGRPGPVTRRIMSDYQEITRCK